MILLVFHVQVLLSAVLRGFDDVPSSLFFLARKGVKCLILLGFNRVEEELRRRFGKSELERFGLRLRRFISERSIIY